MHAKIVWIVGPLAAVALSVSACSSSSTGSPPSAASATGVGPTAEVSSPTGASPAPTASGSGTATTGKLGDTLDTSTSAEDPLKVTLDKVTDPATSTNANNAAYAGSRWVGLQLTVVVEGPDPDNGAAFLVGSDGKDYGYNTSQMIGGFSGCTPTKGNVTQGQPATVCTGAMLPTGVRIAKVAFTGPGTETGAGVVYWTLT